MGNLLLVMLVIIIWASNAVVVKITVSGIPPFWAAFLRFFPTLPFIYLFIRQFGEGIRINREEFGRIATLAVIMFFQIFLFNLGAMYTTGGRVTLIVFSFPLIVPLIAPLFIDRERFNKIFVLGGVISVVGLTLALQNAIGSDGVSTLKGDLIEIVSCLLLATNVVYNKRLCLTINKWKVLIWQFVVACTLFLLAAVLFETLPVAQIPPASWAALVYQSIGVSVFCFLGWQYLLSKHNSSQISVFFFAGPLIGMVLGIILLGERFDPWLLAGCLLVGFGIYLVNRKGHQ